MRWCSPEVEDLSCYGVSCTAAAVVRTARTNKRVKECVVLDSTEVCKRKEGLKTRVNVVCRESVSEEYPHGGEEAYCWQEVRCAIRARQGTRDEVLCVQDEEVSEVVSFQQGSNRCRLFTVGAAERVLR